MDLSIRVQPRAGTNAVEVGEDGRVTVRVTAAPERGRANDAVVRLLAKRLKLSRSSVMIVRGRTSRNKVVSVDGMNGEQAVRRLRDVR